MPRQCTICISSKRSEINKEIINRVSLETIEKNFGVSRFALKRHKAHVVELVPLSPKVDKIATADGIVSDVQDLIVHAENILKECRDVKDNRTALAAIKTLKELLEFRAQISCALKPHQTNNLHLHLGGESGFDDKLAQLIERARLFPVERGGENKALPAAAGT